MKSTCCRWLTALLFAACGTAFAQGNSTPAPEVSASAPLRTAPPRSVKPGPRPMSPAEVRDSTSTTGEIRAQPVTRQISIPLGKKPPPPPKSESDAAARRAAAAPGGIDDAEARCEAMADDQARAKCNARLSGQMSKP